MNGQRKYAVYLPPSYNESERTYPVLYLLHPAGPKGTIPDQSGWINYGQLKQYLDKAIAKGEIAPMIVVTPDANFGTKRISYFNDPENTFNYENFFFEEFIPHIEKTYRCRTDKDSRAIAGASMGGGAALFYALHRPDLFSVSCPLSAAVRAYDKNYLSTRYPDVKEETLIEWYKPYDVYDLVEQLTDDNKSQVAWYITCGDDDALSPNNALLHVAMKKKGVPHEFRMADGKHDWTYWRAVTPEMFQFVSSHFCK